MTAKKIEQFGGMLPAWDDHLLPDGQAASSRDCYLFSGALLGWRTPKLLRALTDPTAKYAYRVPRIIGANQSVNTDITSDSAWLEFADRETDVVRSPIVNDTFQRYYFASPSVQPKYNTYDRIANGDPPFLLGIDPPGCAPAVSVDGGGAAVLIGLPNALSTNVFPLGSNTMYLAPVTPHATALLSVISFVPQTAYKPREFIAALYSSDPTTGEPLALLAAATILPVFDGLVADPTPAGTKLEIGFTNYPTLTANTKYWIAVLSSAAVNMQLADDNAGTGEVLSTTFNNSAPATVTGQTTGQANLQLWGTLSEPSAVQVARAYVYTWISAYGEESPPSPPTLVNGWVNGAWTIGLFQPGAAEATQRNITTTRIYRTVSSFSGNTTYFFVADVSIETETYIDEATEDVIALNDQLASTLWFPPPVDLQGIMSLPNGIMVGFRANEIWFSEVYRPHAWPPSYVLTTDFPIVGIGIVMQSVIICTRAKPYIAVGVNPASMSLVKIEMPEPCISRGSIVSTDDGVLYASFNGLIKVTQYGQASNVTETWITREKWRLLTPSKFLRAIKLASSYFAYGTVDGTDTSVAQQGFTVELTAQDQASFTIWPQPGGHRVGFDTLSAPNAFNISNVMVDPWTGIGLLIQNGSIYYYDFTDTAPVIMPYRWKSKIFQQNAKRNFEAMRIFFTVPPNTPTQNADPLEADTSDVAWNTLQTGQYAIIRVFAYLDGVPVLVTARELRKSGALLRIISGFKAEEWQWEIEGRVLISNLQVATSVKELAGV